MRLLDLPVECFEVELQLAEILGLEFVDLEFDGHQTVEGPIEEQQVEGIVFLADLQRILTSHITKVAAQFDEKPLQLVDQTALQIGLGVSLVQLQELDEVTVLEDVHGFRM